MEVLVKNYMETGSEEAQMETEEREEEPEGE